MKSVLLLSMTAFRANFIVLHGVVAVEAKQEELSYPVFETLITTAVHVDSKPMKNQSKCNQMQAVFKLYLCILITQTGTHTFRAVSCEINAIQTGLYFTEKAAR